MLPSKLLKDVFSSFKLGIIERGIINFLLDSLELLMALIISNLITDAEHGSLHITTTALYALCILISLAFIQYLYYLNAKKVLHFSTQNDKNILANILSGDVRTIEESDQEELAETIIMDGIDMRWNLFDFVAILVEMVLEVIVLGILFIFANKLLVLVCVLLAALIQGINTYLVKKEVALKKEFRDSEHMEKSIYLDIKENMSYIIYNSLSSLYYKRLKEVLDEYKAKATAYAHLVNTKDSLTSALDMLFYIVWLVIGYYLKDLGYATSSDLVLGLFLFTQIKRLFAKAVTISRAKGDMLEYASELEEYMSEKEEETDYFDGINRQASTFAYKDSEVTLPAVQIAPGDKVVLWGKNGTGKTTMMKVLATIYKKDTMPKYSYDYVDAEAFLYDDEVSSGGERKGKELERITSSTKPVIFLDEPETFLDHNLKTKYLNYLKATDKTIIMVTHDQDFKTIATKVVQF